MSGGYREDVGRWLDAMAAAWGSSLAMSMTSAYPPCGQVVEEWGLRAVPVGYRPGHGRSVAEVRFYALLKDGQEVSVQVLQ